MTTQSLGKAKTLSEKILPQLPHHKKELLISLANFGITCCLRHEITNGSMGLPQETVNKLKSYETFFFFL